VRKMSILSHPVLEAWVISQDRGILF
jgi:hypothetical protein